MIDSAAQPQPELLARIRRAQTVARRWFRLQFVLVWMAIIVALVGMFAATGNVDVAWIQEWAPFILGGAGITILVCLSAIVLATVLALVGAIGRLSQRPIPHALASFYVSLVRGTPLIVQIYIIYFSLPSLGIILDAIPAGIIALGFNYGAYMTEIFRAGIQAVPRNQTEAAQALGMPGPMIFRRIQLPQAVRIVTPAIGNEFIAMIKDSALVSIIGVNEVLWRAETSGRPRLNTLEAFIIAAGIYWGLTIIFSFFQERLERRMARGDR
ncbi:MAG TPA: amino acid ABC transporter permease [Candidatus Limnocylindria bacterium]|nr:amino acid ABC transporter permease [Candidatus Limnocylindria bacterium]